mmetsp:Transcript_16168/g.22095  ORF Transcript_16168/g.22095 Transcript_16168/m.22095 type:complete len:124 (-) Transcript_16168:720-1091(-)
MVISILPMQTFILPSTMEACANLKYTTTLLVKWMIFLLIHSERILMGSEEHLVRMMISASKPLLFVEAHEIVLRTISTVDEEDFTLNNTCSIIIFYKMLERMKLMEILLIMKIILFKLLTFHI